MQRLSEYFVLIPMLNPEPVSLTSDFADNDPVARLPPPDVLYQNMVDPQDSKQRELHLNV